MTGNQAWRLQGFENEAYLYILFYCAAEEDYLALYSCGEKKQSILHPPTLITHNVT